MILLQDLSALEDGNEAVHEAIKAATGFKWFDAAGVTEMLIRFGFFMLVLWFIVYFLYYRKTHRRDYFFTLVLLSVSIFFLIYLLGSVKVKIGFALGLFAIFGVLRYRTETIPVREMSYMFGVISLSVINALADSLSIAELLLPNVAIAVLIWLFETYVLRKNLASKLILYDRIELITPERREELLADLRKRTGLEITKLNIGSVDFLKDTAIIKIEYENDGNGDKQINDTLKVPKYEWQDVKETTDSKPAVAAVRSFHPDILVSRRCRVGCFGRGLPQVLQEVERGSRDGIPFAQRFPHRRPRQPGRRRQLQSAAVAQGKCGLHPAHRQQPRGNHLSGRWCELQ
jgi:hypothetical protein